MMLKPNLVQRGQIRHSELPDQSSFRKEILLDFMADKGFLFGTNRSLKQIYGMLDSMNLLEVQIFNTEKTDWLVALHPFKTDQDIASLKQALFDIRLGDIELAERSNFTMTEATLKRSTDFWWDIDNHVMWSFNRPFMCKLKGYLRGESLALNAEKTEPKS
jgi:hypothetical protein